MQVPKCAACHKEFVAGDDVQPIPSIEVVQRGAKSGVLGIYKKEATVGSEVSDYVHHQYGCYEKYFSPMDNAFMFESLHDTIVERVYKEREEEIRSEVIDEFEIRFEEIKKMISEKKHSFCVDCWAELEEDEPPACIWCRSQNYVWMHQKRSGMIFCCTRCNKYWDDEENELDSPG